MQKILMVAVFAGAVMFAVVGCCSSKCDKAPNSTTKCICPPEAACQANMQACTQGQCVGCANCTAKAPAAKK
ncbi:MAG: hypothetical protein LBM70_03210 [Victivallales bacterium]|jgi:hypothetical protein|nr:hypothetical protein [Victivallales bacterium]